MKENIIDAFEVCLGELEKGATIERCLAMYPHFASELRPSLEASIAARSLSAVEVPSRAVQDSRTRVLGYAARMRSDKQPQVSLFRFPSIVFTALLLALVLILGSRELMVVSAESLPGDRLYPLKRAVEDVRVQLAPNQEARYEMESQYREQRVDEVLVLMDNDWQRVVSFEGIVEQMAPTRWVVDGVAVTITADTIVIGDIRLGSLIEVEGLTSPEGWVEAHELHLREFEFVGQVEAIEEKLWVISGVEFGIISITQIDSAIQAGDQVLVLARSRDRGMHQALAILRLPSNLSITVPSMNDQSALIAGKAAGEQFELSGKVEMISASAWVIDGYSVNVNLQTELKDEIELGDYVKAHLVLGVDGALTALEIELESEQIGDDADDLSTDREDDDTDDDQIDDEIEDDGSDDMDEDMDEENDNEDNDDEPEDANDGEDDDEADDDLNDGDDSNGDEENSDSGSDDEGDDNDDGDADDSNDSDDDNSGSDDDGGDEEEQDDDPEETDEPEEPEETDEPDEP